MDTHLSELEQELERAETRCGDLKQQLDYIKLIYNDDKENDEDEYYSTKNESRAKPFEQVTDNKNSTSSNETVEVSRSSSGQTRKEPSKPKSKKGMSRKRIKLGQTKRRKNIQNAQILNNHVKSRERPITNNRAEDNVVEIYKNRETGVCSESGEEPEKKKLKKKRIKQDREGSKKAVVKSEEMIVVIKADVRDVEEEHKVESKKIEEQMTSIDFNTDEIKINRMDENSCCISIEPQIKTNNLNQLQTPPKVKPTDKNLFNNFKIRNIPFCAATSTAKSHNIGLNIQQVLSIIKTRPTYLEPNLDPQNKLIKRNGETASADILESDDKKQSGRPTRQSPTRTKRDVGELKSKSEEDLHFSLSKLKKVLVFLHEDFTSLNEKYRKVQKKLNKRSGTKEEWKHEINQLERTLEKKEEEITVVIGLYREVMSLRNEVDKMKKHILSGKIYGSTEDQENLKLANNTGTRMTQILRQIQDFQDKLKSGMVGVF